VAAAEGGERVRPGLGESALERLAASPFPEQKRGGARGEPAEQHDKDDQAEEVAHAWLASVGEVPLGLKLGRGRRGPRACKTFDKRGGPALVARSRT
jgi:hypothetical protein